MKKIALRVLREDECKESNEILAKAFTPGFKPSKYRNAMVVTIAFTKANTDFIPFTFSPEVCAYNLTHGQRVALLNLSGLEEGTQDGYFDNRLPSVSLPRLKEQAARADYHASEGLFKKAANYAKADFADYHPIGSAEGEMYHRIAAERVIVLSYKEFMDAWDFAYDNCEGNRSKRTHLFFEYLDSRYSFPTPKNSQE